MWQALAVALPAVIALRIATYADVVVLDAVPEVVRISGAAVALFAVVGLGVTRLALPQGLRRHEWLWVLPTGAVATAFAMTPLGFLGIPFRLNLALVVAAGAALTVHALRRHGPPALRGGGAGVRATAWPLYIALLLACVALVPVFRATFLTVTGTGSDAHLAAGTAEFLRHAPPAGVAPELPVDQVPLVWRSKQAIYYAFAAVSELSGYETWQVLSTLAAVILALAAVGWFVFAREVLGTTVGAAVVAMGVAGLCRMVLHTGMHPYFNQTWGYMTLPFALTLAWWVVDRRRPRSPRAVALLLLFLAVCAFAYPLALPIPGTVLLAMWWVDRRARRRAGERVAGVRDVWRGFRRLPRAARLGAYALAFLLLLPAWGVWEKLVGATQLLINHRYSLEGWGGDLAGWFPEQHFFAIDLAHGWWAVLPVIAGLALWELRHLPRPLRTGLLTVLVAATAVAASMRLRDHGWYFHFKMLAFAGPFVIVLAVAALARLRRRPGRRAVRAAAVTGMVVWVSWAADGARKEVSTTYHQLSPDTQELRAWSARLPRGSSVRLDMEPGTQLWAGYLLHEHPTCSQRPLSDTSYPHPPVSRAADFVLVWRLRRPYDAVGAPVAANREFRLFRLRDDLAGGDRCSQRMVQTVSRIERG